MTMLNERAHRFRDALALMLEDEQMTRRPRGTFLIVGLIVGCLTVSVEARVVRIVVERTTPYNEGQSFGTVGSFERLEGTVYMEIDPDNALNDVIVNIERVPRNSDGLV